MREKESAAIDSTVSVPLAPEDIESTVSVPLAPDESPVKKYKEESSTKTVKILSSTKTVKILSSTETVKILSSTETVKILSSTETVKILSSTETVKILGSTETVEIPSSTETVEVQAHFDPDGEMDNYRRNLPHWRQDGALYFITFHLADSLPKEIIEQIRHQRQRLQVKRTDKLQRFEQIEYRRLFAEKIEKILDSGHGANYLADPENGQIVANALRFFHQKRYILDEWVVMPNHVHVIIQPIKNWTIEKITHSWKSYTAHEIAKRLKLSGQFWMHESYDRIIRNETELYHLREYILKNPQKAGLKKGFLLSTVSVPLAQEDIESTVSVPLAPDESPIKKFKEEEGSTETVKIPGSTETIKIPGSTETIKVQELYDNNGLLF
jgi:REP element-mobilizing transposase RayT